MKTFVTNLKLLRVASLVVLSGVILTSGCARYARNVNPLYEPVVTARGGGDVYITMPARQETLSSSEKWVIGTVNNRDGEKIDEIFSPRSPAEIVQSALSQELQRAGYTVHAVTARPAGSVKALDLTSVDVVLDQTSNLSDLKAKCSMKVRLDIYKGGQLLKKLQYESSYSDTNVKDRDLLAGAVLQEALHSIMQRAVPEIIAILEK